jgi:hypothetical protein
MSRPGPFINTLYWPTGASRWAEFYGLADEASIKTINEAAKTKRLASETPDLVLSVTTDYGTTETTGKGKKKKTRRAIVTAEATVAMYMLSPRPLTVKDGQRLWLVPLVDQRYWWRFKSTGELSVSSAENWYSFVEKLATALGVTFDWAPPTADYLNPDPTACTREHADIPHLLDAAAYSMGMRVLCDIDGTVKLQSFTTGETIAAEALDANLDLVDEKKAFQLLAGDEYSNFNYDIGGYPVPANVEVSFPKIRHYVPRIDGDRYVYTVAPNTAYFTDDAGETEPDTVKRFRGSAYADFTTGGGTPDNDSDLETLADAIANDYYLSLRRHYRMIYGGFVNWTPCAYDDHILWVIANDEIRTEVESRPPNYDLEYMLHQDTQTVFDTTIKKGKADEDIVPDSDGTVSIWEAGADSLLNVTAWLNWAHSAEQVSMGKEVLLQFFHDEDKWVVIGKECEDS